MVVTMTRNQWQQILNENSPRQTPEQVKKYNQAVAEIKKIDDSAVPTEKKPRGTLNIDNNQNQNKTVSPKGKAFGEGLGNTAGAATTGIAAGAAANYRKNTGDTNIAAAQRASAEASKRQQGRVQVDAQRGYHLAKRDPRVEGDKDAATRSASRYLQTMSQITGAAGGGAAALASMNVQDPSQSYAEHRQRADEQHRQARAVQTQAERAGEHVISKQASADEFNRLEGDRRQHNLASGNLSTATTGDRGGGGEYIPPPNINPADRPGIGPRPDADDPARIAAMFRNNQIPTEQQLPGITPVLEEMRAAQMISDLEQRRIAWDAAADKMEALPGFSNYNQGGIARTSSRDKSGTGLRQGTSAYDNYDPSRSQGATANRQDFNLSTERQETTDAQRAWDEQKAIYDAETDAGISAQVEQVRTWMASPSAQTPEGKRWIEANKQWLVNNGLISNERNSRFANILNRRAW